ncbi:Zn-ribbon domain-containing OB-fold protein [Acrocarpospora macrocephala]|nr:OB-fold domain-containing protein [Acrocarpospora macrocephala]
MMTTMATRIQMPYTLTPGEATGVFLAELGRRRLIGSRHGDRILVPAQDFDGSTGEPAEGFVELAPAGRLEAFTVTAQGVLGLVLVDGADVPFLHRIVGFAEADLTIGARVAAVWADEPTGSVLDLAGFGPAGDGPGFKPRIAPDGLAQPFEQVEYTMTLDYQHSYGHYYGTLFDAVRTDRRLRGVKCSQCRRTLLPPRARCDVCFAPTAEWVDVEAVGVVQACSVVHIEFIGQRLKPPYVYAELVLDGTSTRLIHMVGGIDPAEARTAVAPGSRVRAVWSDRRTGSLADIDYFELIPGEPS